MKKLISIVLLSLPCLALADTTVICPEDYPTALLTTKGVPAGWKGIAHVAGIRMILTSAGVVVGPPGREVQGLLHGQETKTKSGFRVKFSYLTKFTEPQEKWVYCAYGIGGDLQLLQRVPDETDMCIVDSNRNFYNGYDIRVTCNSKR